MANFFFFFLSVLSWKIRIAIPEEKWWEHYHHLTLAASRHQSTDRRQWTSAAEDGGFRRFWPPVGGKVCISNETALEVLCELTGVIKPGPQICFSNSISVNITNPNTQLPQTPFPHSTPPARPTRRRKAEPRGQTRPGPARRGDSAWARVTCRWPTGCTRGPLWH